MKKGDRVALVLPNCPQNVIAFFATLRLGAVVVEHNPLYTETELRHQLADCGAKVVVCLDRVYETVAKVKKDTSVEHVITTSIVDFLPAMDKLKLRLPVAKAKKQRAELTVTLPKAAPVKDFSALLKGAAPVSRQTPVEGDDLALLQYTGGTTGLSKGAMLTHYNLVSNAYMNRLWDTEAKAGKEVTLAVLPLFHAYGLTVAMTNTILLGGTLVLLPRFDLDLVFKAIDEWKPTLFPGVPPIYKALADSPKAKLHDLRSIRLCVSGAMKLPVEVAEQFTKISGATLIEGYGMTETSPSTHANPTTGPGKPGTIGLPLPGTLCKIVDQDDATKLVPIGQPGELAIAGPQVFSGYWGREDQEGVFTADGYVLTGDVAVMDEDGYFSIVDRKKELIIAGGFNIYPSEVEEVLFTLAGVAGRRRRGGARQVPRRDGQGVRGEGPGREAHRGRRDRSLRGVAHGLQGAEARRVPHRASAHGGRQGAAPGAGRGGEGQARPPDSRCRPRAVGPGRRAAAKRSRPRPGQGARSGQEGTGQGREEARPPRRRRPRRRPAKKAATKAAAKKAPIRKAARPGGSLADRYVVPWW